MFKNNLILKYLLVLFIFILSILYIVYMGMDFDYAIVTLDNWFSNKTVVFISKKNIFIFSFLFLNFKIRF